LTRELEESKYDLVILSAAVSDFKPQSVSDTKISTDTKSLDLKLIPTLKIIDKVKQIQHKTFLVAFKAEYSISKQHLIEKSFNKLIQCNADLIVANDVGSGQKVIGADTNKVVIVDKNRNFYDFAEQKKNIVAENIFKLVYLYLKDCEDK
jgi:phosphopantothenoylcysteine decarboxylase/phosphopantothenate--cysteine ligase